MPSHGELGIKILQNPGVLVAPLRVFPGAVEEELSAQDREHSEICAEEVACLPQQRCFGNGPAK